jgi:uncharacterized DUF497 family protein
MEFEFDPAKDEANLRKHGLRLAFGMQVFDGPYHAILPSHRLVDGEDRYKAVGLVDGRLFTLVHTWRGEKLRCISVRRSDAGEQRNYDRNPGRSR